jgi:ribosomal protein S18 acetylase RimI-like enzyme
MELVPVHDILIRPACLDDARSLHCHCYPEANYDDVHDYLAWCLSKAQSDRICRLVAEADGLVVGNIQLTVWGQRGEIGSLVVSRGYRRRGVARRMILTLIDEAQRRSLSVLQIGVSQRQAAILAFYQRMGFKMTQGEKAELSHPTSPEPVILLRMYL